MKKYLGIIGCIIVAGLGVMSCSKAEEPFKDAPKQPTRNDDPAQIIEMPDGFSNVAGKCDGPNYVYVAFKGDSNRAAIGIAPNDPRCK